jgi:hypothetical protein
MEWRWAQRWGRNRREGRGAPLLARRHGTSCAYLQKPGKSKQFGNGVRLWKFTFQSVWS